MSRTKRRKRPKMNLGTIRYKQYADGKVRDGTPTHSAPSCRHHGGCKWCERDRDFICKESHMKQVGVFTKRCQRGKEDRSEGCKELAVMLHCDSQDYVVFDDGERIHIEELLRDE